VEVHVLVEDLRQRQTLLDHRLPSTSTMWCHPRWCRTRSPVSGPCWQRGARDWGACRQPPARSVLTRVPVTDCRWLLSR
jgi:hypothetical protein